MLTATKDHLSAQNSRNECVLARHLLLQHPAQCTGLFSELVTYVLRTTCPKRHHSQGWSIVWETIAVSHTSVTQTVSKKLRDRSGSLHVSTVFKFTVVAIW